MLELQKYLLTENSPQSLEARGIYSYRHPTLPLIAFKYDQIEASKSDPIVCEARGIVLELETYKVVAKSFDRFFNLGEFPEKLEAFDWTNFTTTSKEDGSLAIIYFYAGEWHMNTSGSFGLSLVNSTDKSWRDLFWETAARNGLRKQELNPRFTYVFELCTGYNKVVRRYAAPSIFLLSVFDPIDNCYEFDEFGIDTWADVLGVKRPRRWHCKNRQDIADLLDEVSSSDPSFEGFVIKDTKGNRWKCKTMSYCALHHMKDNGNIILPDRLVTICLTGEKDEVKAIMPEISSALDLVDKELAGVFNDLNATWEANKGIESQKDFAMAVKNHKFSGLLFGARKSSEPLDKLWRRNPEAIAEKIFGKRTFEFDVLDVQNACTP